MKSNGTATSVYSIVTDRIISEMEKGIIPWIKPWDHVGPVFARNAITKKPYSLMNQMLLGMSGGYWLTWKQLTERNGTLNKGAKASIVVFYKMNEYEKTDENGHAIVNENGEAEKRRVPMLRYYKVFNVLDTSLADQYVNIEEERNNEAIDDAEKIISGYVTGSGIGFYNKESNEAYYSPSEDYVKVPSINQFDNVAEYYSTTFHELVHSTGHPDRLDRLTKTHFGSSKYAKEELVAEMGAAFALATIGIDNKQAEQNNVAYLQNWIKQLQEDDHLIVSAASMAEKAVNFIMETAESADIEDEEEVKEISEPIPTKTTPRRPSAQSKTSKKDKKVRKTKKNAEKKEENKKKQEKAPEETNNEEVKAPTPAETPKEEPKNDTPMLIKDRIQECNIENPYPNYYRVTIMINNETKVKLFNHEPSTAEIEKAFNGKFMEGERK